MKEKTKLSYIPRSDDSEKSPSPKAPYFVYPQKENICAIVITFFPDELFGRRLEKISRQVAKTIIVDNTADPKHPIVLSQVDCGDIRLIQNQENVGIGEALNQGMSVAAELKLAWAITFDQDSWVHEDLVSSLIRIIEVQQRPDVVGIVGCNFEDEHVRSSPISPLAKRTSFIETKTVITSGSLISLIRFSEIGPFRSDFFMDFVDHEYCLRCRKLGYKVIVSTAPLMIHALGTPTMRRIRESPDAFSIVLTNRPPVRRYYMSRNVLLVAAEYYISDTIWVLRYLVSILIVAPLKILFEDSFRGKKFFASILGAIDAFRGVRGRVKISWLRQ